MKPLLTVFIFFAAIATAFAQQPTAEELDHRVRALEQKLEALQAKSQSAELDELKREIDVLTQEIESMKIDRQKPAAAADVQQYGLGAAASKVYRSEGGVSIGGYGEWAYDNFARRRDNGVPSGATSTANFLRAVLYTGYKFNEKTLFNSELEVENATTERGGSVSMEFGYLDFLQKPQLNLRAGIVLVPVGLINQFHEPTAVLSVHRPEVETRIIPATWGEAGAGIFGDIGRVSYQSYVVTGLDAREFNSEEPIREGRQAGGSALARDLAFVGRVDLHPIEGAMIGGSFYTGKSGQGAGFGARVTLAEAHADFKIRGALLRALWSTGSIGDAAAVNAAAGLTGDESVGKKFGGWYTEAGYDISNLLPRTKASVTPFVRYERLDTQREVPAGFARNPENDLHVWTSGVAWKPIPQTVIKVDYQNSSNRARTGTDRWSLGLGYIF
jgi:hypothetical protein